MKKAFIQLHAAVFLAGFTGILGRLITLNEIMLVWYRMLIASLGLWVLLYFQKKIRKIPFRDMLHIAGIGAIVAFHWVSFYGSIKYANVSVALVCFSATGFFTAVLEPLITKKAFQLREILFSMLAVAGIYLIFHFDPAYKTGIIFGIISAVLACLFPIFNRGLLSKFSASTVTLYELGGGFIILTLFLPVYLKQFPADRLLPGIGDLAWLLILGLVCTVLAFNLSMKALTSISAFTVNLSFNLEPIYGILLAFWIFREDKYLSDFFFLGLLLILVSVLLQTISVYRKRGTGSTNPSGVAQS